MSMNIERPLAKSSHSHVIYGPLRLKKDLVIPAGTVFNTASVYTERYGEGHVQAVFGLSPNTSGDITYDVSGDIAELEEWFEVVDGK
jgi:hypothetical protein